LGKKNKLSVGLFVPLRSADFKDKYKAVTNNPNIKSFGILLPIAISVGFNFGLHKSKEDIVIPKDTETIIPK